MASCGNSGLVGAMVNLGLWCGVPVGGRTSSLMARWGCHCQYKASCSRHFISEDAQERQDKEVFQQNMKRRLESFKSTKHNICFTKSKPRPRKASRKKACAFSRTPVCSCRLMACCFELTGFGIQPQGPGGCSSLGSLLHLPGSPEGKVKPSEGEQPLVVTCPRQQDHLPEVE